MFWILQPRRVDPNAHSVTRASRRSNCLWTFLGVTKIAVHAETTQKQAENATGAQATTHTRSRKLRQQHIEITERAAQRCTRVVHGHAGNRATVPCPKVPFDLLRSGNASHRVVSNRVNDLRHSDVCGNCPCTTPSTLCFLGRAVWSSCPDNPTVRRP